MVDTLEFKKLQKEYLSTVFGVEYNADIQIIPESIAGKFEVKDDVDINDNYIFQKLLYNGVEICNNNPIHLDIHKRFIKVARGNVFVSGLGLGTSLNELLKKPEIKSVTIIEKEKDIIKLVSPAFTDKRVKVICADVFKYIPEQKFDFIYHALWNTKESVNQGDLKIILNRFDEYCKKQMAVFYSGKSSGGKRPGAGRKAGTFGEYKKESEKRIIKKGLRYTEKEYELITKAAQLIGKNEAYIAQVGAVKEAKEILLKKGMR